MLLNKLYKFLDNLKINSLLEKAEKTEKFKKFKTDVEKAIKQQINILIEENNLKKLYEAGLQTTKIDEPEVLEETRARREPNEKLIEIMTNMLSGYFLINLIKKPYSFYLNLGEMAGQRALNDLGFKNKFNLTNQSLQTQIITEVNKRLSLIDHTTKDYVGATVEDSILNNWTLQDLKDVLKEEIQGIGGFSAKLRSDIIASNEANFILNVLRKETYKRNGVMKIKWVTARDERVCPICAPLDNEVRNDGQSFSNVYAPPVHTRCRCYIAPVYLEAEINLNYAWAGGY